MLKFSVIISIYENNVPELLRAALYSLLGQTLLPDEILIVADGPVPVLLEQEVQSFRFKVQSLPQSSPPSPSSPQRSLLASHPGGKGVPEVTYLPLEMHGGLGEAMRRAVEVAKGDYVARMDADDICLPDRFEKQMKCFEEDPTLSVVGGQIAEFDGDVKNITGRRVVPLRHDEIVKYMKSRNGMNHVTTILKKKDLVDSGNYQPFFLLEDYYLWIRMIQHGFRFKNIKEDVVLVRAGKEQMDRRGGIEYFIRQCEVFKYMLKANFISLPRFLMNITERGIVHVLLPIKLRSLVYLHLLRKK